MWVDEQAEMCCWRVILSMLPQRMKQEKLRTDRGSVSVAFSSLIIAIERHKLLGCHAMLIHLRQVYRGAINLCN